MRPSLCPQERKTPIETQESRRWTRRVRRPGTAPWVKTNGMVQVRKTTSYSFVFARQCTKVLMKVGRSKVRIASRRRYDKTTRQKSRRPQLTLSSALSVSRHNADRAFKFTTQFPFNLTLSMKGTSSKRWTAHRTRRLRGNYCSAMARSHTAEHTKYRSF